METNAQELERRIEVLEKQVADRLAAAYRAGAREALDAVEHELTKALRESNLVQDLLRNGKNKETARNTYQHCINILRNIVRPRYAEPEEEKEG